jgi:signal transduction histidine kinase
VQVARDLHDFVAHDVTAMVVQAQAAQVVARRDQEEALAVVERIEDAGLRALEALDRTVHMLGDLSAPGQAAAAAAPAPHGPPAGARVFAVEELLTPVGRFAATDGVAVRLDIDFDPGRRIPPEVGSAAHRVIVEALTNVRRHARAVGRVGITLTHSDGEAGPSLAVRVLNDAPSAVERPSALGGAARGGRGLAALAAEVERLGGSFSAGPSDARTAHGWLVTAVLPLYPGGRP